MKKYTGLALLLILTPSLLLSFMLVPMPESAIAAPRSRKTGGSGVWHLSLQALGSTGRAMRNPIDPDSTLKAAGQWVYVQVRITNTSATRQSAKNLILTTSSKLVNPSGKAYELDDIATEYVYNRLEAKPFNPGESRDIYFFFDTPTNEIFQRLEIVAIRSLVNIPLSLKELKPMLGSGRTSGRSVWAC
jgi:hypothetical protein